MSKMALFWVLLGIGCVKPVPQTAVTQAKAVKVEKPPFVLDAPPERLTAGCETGHLEGCNRHQLLQRGQRDLALLHQNQTIEMIRHLHTLNGILNRSNGPPTARISTRPLDTNSWTDPEGIYPAQMVVRLEYERGLHYLGDTALKDIRSVLATLKTLSRGHGLAWQQAKKKYPRDLSLPEELLAERAKVEVTVVLVDETIAIKLPDVLAREFLRRDVSPWDAVAAHVVKEAGSPYKVVEEHRYELSPVFSISSGSGIQIVELAPRLDRTEFVSSISPIDACKGLRGELRYVRRNQKPALRASITAVSKAGGAR